MDALVTTPPAAEVRNIYRCARCGVESAEHSCFVIPERHDKSPRDIRCITCEQSRLAMGTLEGLIGILRTTFVPVLILVVSQRGLGDVTLPVLLTTCLMAPVSIIVHELGHAVTARFLGLEVGAVIIGIGPRLWRGEVLRTAVTLHAWPLSGLTFLGARSLDFLRSRLWLTTLMGPATNILLAIGTAAFWPQLVGPFGTALLSMWIITNALLAMQSLTPCRFSHAGQMLNTDGLALLQLPRATSEQLEPYLFTAPLLRAFSRFEAQDYAAARSICAKALERVPDNVHLRVLLAASCSHAYDPARSLALLRPLLQSHAEEQASVRAAVENNAAFALLMSNPKAGYDARSLLEADRLSANAFSMYPCVLAYRSTRALVLTAAGRPDQALALLEYSHYDTAERVQRGQRETARAFALHVLGREADSQRAAAEAIRLDAQAAALLKRLEVGAWAPARSSPHRLSSTLPSSPPSRPSLVGLAVNDPTARR